MHPPFEKAAGLTEAIIGAAIEVHRDKGPGLIESIYEWCLTKELELRGFSLRKPKDGCDRIQGIYTGGAVEVRSACERLRARGGKGRAGYPSNP